MTTKPRRAAKRRLQAAGAALTCGFILLVGPAALAADDHHDGAIDSWWDGSTLNVPWDGSDHYETIAEDRFHHDAVAVPGDWIYRTLAVRNNGPCGGKLTIEILNPNAAESADTVNHDDTSVTQGRTGFNGMSEIHWHIGDEKGSDSFAELAHEQDLATVPIGKNETIPVRVAYKFPYDETEGKHLGQPSQVLMWDLGLRLQGDYCEADDYSASPSPTDFPTTPGPSKSGGGPGKPTGGATQTGGSGQDKLEITGSNAAFGAISAAFLIAAGATMVIGRYRDRRARQAA